MGEQLGKYVKSVKGFKRRECFKKIEEFIYSDLSNSRDILSLCSLKATYKLLEDKKNIYINPKYIYVSNDILVEFIN